jgi:Winged helix-turn helix
MSCLCWPAIERRSRISSGIGGILDAVMPQALAHDEHDIEPVLADRHRHKDRRLRLLGRRILPAQAGHRLLKAKTQAGTLRAANDCHERWRAEDDGEQETGTACAESNVRPTDRKAALNTYRRPTDPDPGLRAHVLLLLDAGQPWAQIVALLFTSTTLINRWRKRCQKGGIDAVLNRPYQRPWRGPARGAVGE